jgi:hypothetical protein
MGPTRIRKMKVSELRVTNYCDYCPAESRRATQNHCVICFRDVCEKHVYPVGVRRTQNQSYDSHGPPPQGVLRLGLDLPQLFEFYPVCVDCSGRSLVWITAAVLNLGKDKIQQPGLT